MQAPFLLSVALAAIALLLGGCQNPFEPHPTFAETAPLPEPLTLLEEYGDLAPGTFVYTRYTSSGDIGEVFSGTALYGAPEPTGIQRFCLKPDSFYAPVIVDVPDTAPGLYTSRVRMHFPMDLDGGADPFVLVTDTSARRVNGVFATRIIGRGILHYRYTAIVEGGFNAAYADSPGC